MFREPLRWQTQLGQWVADVTPAGLVHELRGVGHPVTESAVYKWVAGTHQPRPELALQLVELSGGRVSIVDVYLQRYVLAGADSDDGRQTFAGPV